MQPSSACRRILADGDFRALRRVWDELFPHLPPPGTDEEAEVVLHHARTQTESVDFRQRAWSHKWLLERGLPSALPEDLKPKAQQIEPLVIEAVGIAASASAAWLQPAVTLIRRKMEDAVQDAFAEGRRDPAFVKARMMEARAREQKALFGNTKGPKQ